MVSLTKINSAPHHITLTSTRGVISKVEKWSETQFTTKTEVSGGGGYIYQGTGYIEPTNVQVTTSANTSRHTRVYYDENGRTNAITAYNFDLEVIEGSEILIIWYRCEGFQDKVAGFVDSKTQRWYLLNDGSAYFMNWLGIVWINIPYMIKLSSIFLVVSLICTFINVYFGLVVAIMLGLIAIIGFGKIGFNYLLNMSKYCHWKAFSQAQNELKAEFITLVSLKPTPG